MAVKRSSRLSFLTIPTAISLWLGCSSAPSAVTAPNVDPQEAASEAIAAYDRNGDQVLSPEEMSAAPGLAAAVGADADGDGKLSQEEIAKRIEGWTAGGVAMVFVPLNVTYKGKPLPGATVKFVPEKFLGPTYKGAVGVTNDGGTVMMRVPDEDLPEQNRGLGAMYMGFYRVEVTHPSIALPAHLNENSTVGIEIAGDYRMDGLTLALK